MTTVSVNDTTLFYTLAGHGHPTLVFIHAGVTDSRLWEPQMKVFADSYQVLTYDMRGFGQSRIEDVAYQHHEDLRALLGQLEIAQAVLVGCSKGGMIAIEYALAYPDQVIGLFLVAPAVRGLQTEPPRGLIEIWDEVDKRAEAGDLRAASALEMRAWLVGLNRPLESVEAGLRDLVTEMNLTVLQNEVQELGDEQPLKPHAADRLPELKMPVSVMIGAEDNTWSHARVAKIMSDVPQAMQITLENAAHLPSLEHPATFNQHLQTFLEGLT